MELGSDLDWWESFIDSNRAVVERKLSPENSPVRVFTRPPNPDRPSRECSGLAIGDDTGLVAETLETQSALCDDVIKAGVIEWSETWTRPEFAGDVEFFFLFRLSLASHVIGVANTGRLGTHLQPSPEPKNKSEVLRWLLIDVWDRIGSNYLQGCAADALCDLS
jgi:hypothetical protein